MCYRQRPNSIGPKESFLKRLTGIHSHGDNCETLPIIWLPVCLFCLLVFVAVCVYRLRCIVDEESNEGVALENSDVKAIESYHSTST